MTTPVLTLDELAAAQDQPEVPINADLRKLDVLVQPTVFSRVASLPGSPVSGERYILTAATGGGQIDDIAYYSNGWLFITPLTGWEVWIRDERLKVRWGTGSPLGWDEVTSTGGGGASITVTATGSPTVVVTDITEIIVAGQAVVDELSPGVAQITVLDQSGGGGGGGGGFDPWVQDINEDGSTLTNWTQVSGSWANSGGKILANNPANSTEGDNWALTYTVPVPTTLEVFEADILVTSWNAGTVSRVGLYFCGSFSASNPQNQGTTVCFQFDGTTNQASLEWVRPFTAGGSASGSFALVLGSTHNMRLVKAGGFIDVFIDGVYVTTIVTAPTNYGDVANQVGLYCGGVTASFSNIKHWSPANPM